MSKNIYCLGFVQNDFEDIEFYKNNVVFEDVKEEVSKEFKKNIEYFEELFTKNTDKPLKEKAIFLIYYDLDLLKDDIKNKSFSLNVLTNNEVYDKINKKTLKSKKYKENLDALSEYSSFALTLFANKILEELNNGN